MADDNFKNVVSQLKKNSDKNTDVLNKQSTILTETGKQISLLNANMKQLLLALRMSKMDDLESKREARKGTDPAKIGSGKSTGGLSGLGGMGKVLAGLIAGLGAIGAGLMGLRGWELKALKNIKSIGNVLKALIPIGLADKILGAFTPKGYDTFSSYFLAKIKNLRLSALKAFGFDITLKGFNKPDSGFKTPLRTQLVDKVNDMFKGILRSFGLARKASGALYWLPTTAGPPGSGGRIVSGARFAGLGARAVKAMDDILGPISRFVTSTTSWIGGKGAGMFKFLRTWGLAPAVAGMAKVAGPVGGVLKSAGGLFGKILWPIGVIISLFDGIKAFRESKGGTFEKIMAGVFGFIGDFLGAPLNLLKKLIVGAFEMMGIGYDPETGEFSDWLKWLKKFDIEASIKAIPNLIMKIFDGIKAFLADPIGVGKQVLQSITGVMKDMFIGIMQWIVSTIPGMGSVIPIPDWLKTDAQKQLSALKDQLTTGENQMKDFAFQFGADHGFQGEFHKDKLDASMMKQANLQHEIARINKLISTGNYAGWFSNMVGGIGSEKEARKKIAEAEHLLRIEQGRITGARWAGMAMKSVEQQNKLITEQIENLTAAIKTGAAFKSPILDASTTNHSTNSHTSNLIAANTDNFDKDAKNLSAHPIYGYSSF